LVYPGEEVVLNGRREYFCLERRRWVGTDFRTAVNCASDGDNGFMTVGSGLKLCNDTTYTTIYVRDNVTGLEPPMGRH
jgi:hypothetical protein